MNSIFLTTVLPLYRVSWEMNENENMQEIEVDDAVFWWWTAHKKSTIPGQSHHWIETLYKCATKKQYITR